MSAEAVVTVNLSPGYSENQILNQFYEKQNLFFAFSVQHVYFNNTLLHNSCIYAVHRRKIISPFQIF